jgi:hypothetical protein
MFLQKQNNMKTNLKKLIPICLMVVLSSICVVSSTYAWFVANTHVTAGVGNISVTNTRKLKYTAILYRSDGVYFDC